MFGCSRRAKVPLEQVLLWEQVLLKWLDSMINNILQTEVNNIKTCVDNPLQAILTGGSDSIKKLIATLTEVVEKQSLSIVEMQSTPMERDRAKYIQGDFRFRRVLSMKNARKLMKTLAEKEMRNLKRINDARIRCPIVHDIKLHVLVMDFIGKAGYAVPLLNDVALSIDKLREGYRE